MSAQPVIAIAANPAMDAAIEAFLHALRHKGRGAQAYIHMIGCQTDRIIGLFVHEAMELAKVSATQRKIVDFAVDTASKASGMLTTQVYKKVSNEQFSPIADDLARMYWPAGPDNNHMPQLYYVADADFARRYQQVIDACIAGQGRAQIAQILAIMDVIINDVIDKFFLEQTKYVEIGFITRKTMDVGVGATRAACRAMIHKVIRDFDDAQLQQFMGHYARMLMYK